MAKHLQRELENIKKRILSLGALVEDRVRLAVKSIKSRNTSEAEQIINLDHEIDEIEVEIEEECLKILALHQPVAVDLRFLVAVIKINNDLERIADEAVNIAYRVKTIAKNKDCNFIFDYTMMAEKAKTMLRMSLDSLVHLDTDMAMKVCLMDDEVDAFCSRAYEQLKESIRQMPDKVGILINMFLVSRHLERIGDHATNIAEEVIYLTEGEIIRHGNF
ncbi:MAG: phosphate transport system regulatory protein PhoU [Desulfobacteraceae bacterium IS3]|nr:MAG: phosphate transport system regulatory protein PhoU [Desulfobacteraceae bacterium IS3]HAO19729.1 phosphate transport system regulatory protein PhoU [Desulfobacteraceae bacterium]